MQFPAEIEYFSQPVPQDAVFSIIIPTWNNLSFLKTCIRSLRQHSSFTHEIIVHVNEGTDGTLEWVKQESLPYTYSKENCGVCHALNAAATLAHTPYICFFNDDMYALPGWDDALMKVIRSLDHDLFFLSATMIEPRDTGNRCVIVKEYGTFAENFREEELLENFLRLKKEDWCGATWPPNVVPKKLWDAVGGYSVEFSPGMGSDPDFSMKLWQKGVRHFQGVGSSRAYHFLARSTGRIQKNDGARQFLHKWGITPRVFAEQYLRRGEPWKGPLKRPGAGALLGKLSSTIKKLFG